jgi:acylglycerol lipase
MATLASGTQHAEDRFPSFDGLKLSEQIWRPTGEPIGILAIVHGLADHGGRYSGFAEQLAGIGFMVYAIDLRGHGLSEGKHQFVSSFEEHYRDLEVFLQRIRAAHPSKPLFLMGHSMGGLIVVRYVLSRKPKLSGVILSGPALLADEVSGAARMVVKAIASVLPRMPTQKLDANAISRDPAVVAANLNDSLVHRSALPARTTAELLNAIEQTHKDMEELELPFLIVHGTADKLASVDGSRQLYARSKSSDKSIRLYEGAFHELLNEPEQGKVKVDIIDWLNQHTHGAQHSPAAS